MSTRTSIPIPVSQSQSGVRWYGVSVTLLVIWIISMMDKVTIGIFIADKSFLSAIGILGKPGLAGLLVSSFLVSYGVATFVWGFIVDKYGAKSCLIVSTVIWGILEIAQGLAHSSTELYILRAIMGVSEASIWPASMVMTAKWFPLKERARANSIWLNGINIGPVVGILFVTIMIVHHGWRLAFIVAGILQLVLSTVMLLFLTAETPEKHKWISQSERNYISESKATDGRMEGSIKVQQRTIGQVLSDYKWWFVLIIWTFDTIVYYTVTTWFASYMNKVRHLSLQNAGLVNSLSFVVAVIFMLVAGYVADRLMRRAPVGVVGYVLAGFTLLFAIHASTATGAVIWFALTMALKNSGSIATTTMFHNNAPALSLGGITGLQQGPTNLVTAFGPYLFGLVIFLSGGFNTGLYGIVGLLLICATFSLILALKGE
ncbi:MFS transporter [Alicyclobacillus fastidiosus]|uniref:MFS transporter n=1 Tax=Alicyclobacillus fastidiosus TaxID=392011 RepID=A0ABY6ZB39_9BACL|nr:MFS transporter [Alicyclobacillus fastidiosus]WAH40077.1 MFS transporter [Alicyclobacillus fastidiosus]GMA61394.1 MFS transporter [Alicyclobacillus fastidiosus]